MNEQPTIIVKTGHSIMYFVAFILFGVVAFWGGSKYERGIGAAYTVRVIGVPEKISIEGVPPNISVGGTVNGIPQTITVNGVPQTISVQAHIPEIPANLTLNTGAAAGVVNKDGKVYFVAVAPDGAIYAVEEPSHKQYELPGAFISKEIRSAPYDSKLH